jgi:hypothetical protein
MTENDVIEAMKQGLATDIRLLRERIASTEISGLTDADGRLSGKRTATELSKLRTQLKLLEEELVRLNQPEPRSTGTR